ncbi:YggS family pyridoxal phosphate-dependent enzyme [Phytohabitans aurantiacus]|uniref:Pyridoxal phosphate homeostasis protein n=1 Tax=Phytohabitans aurantiacus TaxID=3016789 RepID=A0ABQ5RA73_9ACTN|nr:YggS family pyridoxal phosphate-dependent enzyme [Phytohabitans aurantiacus]GLI03570.1 YggS family pyridoxal phosphate enzyme [Phytohabitans aurantiacus]
MTRAEEISAGLAAVNARIERACAAAGRDPDEITLIVVTKTYPASDVELLAGLGVVDVGENRDQEAAPKAAAVSAPVRWHFVGQLQRNKCRSVVTYADAVHSVDGVRLAETLAGAAQRHRERALDVLVQVSIDGDPARGGAVRGGDADRDLERVAAAVAEAPALRLAGVMAVAPMDWTPDAAFASLARTAVDLRAAYPEATAISAGMSGDLEAAIVHGATHVRIGSAVLGTRDKLR